MAKMVLPPSQGCFDPIFFILAGNENLDESSDEFEVQPDRTTDGGIRSP